MGPGPDPDPGPLSLRGQHSEETCSHSHKENPRGHALVCLEQLLGSYLQRDAVHAFTQGAVVTPVPRERSSVTSSLLREHSAGKSCSNTRGMEDLYNLTALSNLAPEGTRQRGQHKINSQEEAAAASG